jgi:hypothetical protein
MEAEYKNELLIVENENIFFNPTADIDFERRERLIQSRQCNEGVLRELVFEKTLHDLQEQQMILQQEQASVEVKMKQEQVRGNLEETMNLQNVLDKLKIESRLCDLQEEILRFNFIKHERYYKSNVVEVLPDLLRLGPEANVVISVEGAVLFITARITDSDAQKLYALKRMIERHHRHLEKEPHKREEIQAQLGWCHLERRSGLSEMAIANDEARFSRIKDFKRMIRNYRFVSSVSIYVCYSSCPVCFQEHLD